jgi:hypothetical protein
MNPQENLTAEAQSTQRKSRKTKQAMQVGTGFDAEINSDATN